MDLPLDSGPLAYREKGRGRPFVLLNGPPFGAGEFDDVLGALSWSSRAVAVDLPGVGDSAGLPDPSPAALAEVLLLWFAKLGLDSFVLAASDVAGPVACEILARQPGMVSGALLFDTWATGDGIRIPEYLVSGKTGILDLFRTRTRTQSDIAGAMGKAERLTPELLDLAVARLGKGGRRRGQALFHSSLASPLEPRREALSHYRKPVRILRGERDPLCPDSQVRALAELLPQARAEAVPGAGHFLGIEAGEALAQQLQELGREAWA
jgi:pimeloyl-ACP methyl ester carboxylesterase